MNEKQKSRYLAFIANFVDQLHKAQFCREQAVQIGELAAIAWLLTQDIRPGHGKQDEYVVIVLKMAIERFYPSEREPVPDVFRQAFESEPQ